MKRVLIPTDFSHNAWNAISYACQLFRNENCRFILLNTYTPSIPSNRFMAPMVNGMLIEDAVRHTSEVGLEKTLERIEKVFPNANHEFVIQSSFSLLVDAVQEIVDQEEIDLIVTGTKGASGMDEVFMGSNTVRIIKSSRKCPVLAVPQHFDFIQPGEIAFATDFNRFYTQSELAPLLELAQSFKATVRIVHVQYGIQPLSEVQQFNLKMLLKYMEPVEHYVHKVSELHSVSQTLEVFTHQLGIHLLALLNYQHSYVERFTREPIVKRTAFHTQIPLLVIPELGMEIRSTGSKEQSQEFSKV